MTKKNPREEGEKNAELKKKSGQRFNEKGGHEGPFLRT